MQILFISMFLIMSGCTTTHSGYSFENLKPYETIIGKTTKNDIIATLGNPTFKSENEDVFFYISQKDMRFLFLRHISINRKSLTLTFSGDVLKGVQTNNL